MFQTLPVGYTTASKELVLFDSSHGCVYVIENMPESLTTSPERFKLYRRNYPMEHFFQCDSTLFPLSPDALALNPTRCNRTANQADLLQPVTMVSDAYEEEKEEDKAPSPLTDNIATTVPTKSNSFWWWIILVFLLITLTAFGAFVRLGHWRSCASLLRRRSTNKKKNMIKFGTNIVKKPPTSSTSRTITTSGNFSPTTSVCPRLKH